MHRVYCQMIPNAGMCVTLDDRENEHLFKVFRASAGDRVQLIDCCGTIAEGEVVPGKQIMVRHVENFPEPAEKIILCCALPRKQKLDTLLKQITELGVWSFQPVRCERSVAYGDPKERWEVLFREACKQSGNPYMPKMEKELTLPELLDDLTAAGTRIYYGSVVPEVTEFAGQKSEKVAKALLIGPEGGFSDGELELIRQKGGKGINFAPHILRLETAAVAGAALLRLVSLLAVAGAFMLLCGCSPADVSRNPLALKAERLRQSGDIAGSRRFYRQLVSRYPENPDAYYLLGVLCDEELDDHWEAMFCYRSFLQLCSPDDVRREDVQKLLKRSEQKITGTLLKDSPEMQALKKEFDEVVRQNESLRRHMISQKLYINRMLRRMDALEKRSASGKKSGTKKGDVRRK